MTPIGKYKTQPISYTGTTRVCVQNVAAVRRAVSEFIVWAR